MPAWRQLLAGAAAQRWLFEGCRASGSPSARNSVGAGHRGRARRHLLAARDGFAAMAAEPWLARTRQRAARHRYPASASSRSAIGAADSAGTGDRAPGRQRHDQRQIAERLYLSHRTVGAHLYRIFPQAGRVVPGRTAGRAVGSPESGRPVSRTRPHTR